MGESEFKARLAGSGLPVLYSLCPSVPPDMMIGVSGGGRWLVFEVTEGAVRLHLEGL